MKTTSERLPVRMLVDTSVWLALAADPKDAALVGVIERLVADGHLVLLVPEIVLEEFEGRRDRVAQDHGKRMSAHFRTIKELIQTSATDTDLATSVLQFLDQVESAWPARTKYANQTFKRIDMLLQRGSRMEVSDTIKLAVFERGIRGKAPFHTGDNEAADAVIIESYSASVRGEPGVRHIFVTRNTKHFSADKGSEKIPHSDFDCFTPGKSDYFVSLPEALLSVDSRLVTELLGAWELEQPSLAELIDRYIEEAPSRKPLGDSQSYILRRLRDAPLGRKNAAKLQAKDIVEYCRKLGEEAVPTTIRQHFGYLRIVLEVAEHEWNVLGVSADAAEEARRQVEAEGLMHNFQKLRGRRPTSDELDRLIQYYRDMDGRGRARLRMADVTEMALVTGRDLGEIFSLRWADFDERDGGCVLKGKRFPLQDAAVEIIKRMPRISSQIFPGEAHSASASFTAAKHALGIEGLRFKDLRREAIMRMLEHKLPLERIEALTGLGPLSLGRYREQFGESDTRDVAPWERVRRQRYRPRRRKRAAGDPAVKR